MSGRALGAEDGDGVEDEDEPLDEAELDDGEGAETEIRRLQDEIERCRAAQHALERYVAALDGSSRSRIRETATSTVRREAPLSSAAAPRRRASARRSRRGA